VQRRKSIEERAEKDREEMQQSHREDKRGKTEKSGERVPEQGEITQKLRLGAGFSHLASTVAEIQYCGFFYVIKLTFDNPTEDKNITDKRTTKLSILIYSKKKNFFHKR
jgi:hypothetical protein